MRRFLLVAFVVPGAMLVSAEQVPVSPIDARVSKKEDVNPKSTPYLPATSPSAQLPAPGPPTDDYELGPGDQISIIVSELQDDPSFQDQKFRIGTGGDVSLPLIGRLHAAGLTTQQLEQAIAARMGKLIKEPTVSVEVAEFASQPVSVLGEVNQAGQYQVQGAKKLLAALSMAQGFTEYVGNTITITRELQWGRVPLPNAKDDSTGQFSVATVSVKNVLHSSSPEQNIQMMPNDVVSVSKAEIVYVVGAVNMPGGFPLGQDETLSTLQVLSLAQGPEHTASLQKAKIIRLVTGSKARTEVPIDLKQLLAGRVADVSLQPGDILFVPTSGLKTAQARTVQAIVNAATGAAVFAR